MDSFLRINKIDKSIFEQEHSREYCKLLLDMVQSPSVRSLLFGTSITSKDEEKMISKMTGNKIKDPSKIVSVLRSIISLSYVSAITRWKQVFDDNTWGDDVAVTALKKSRFSKLFASASGKEDISLDLQIFSLIELWVCIRDHDDVYCSLFNGIYADDMAGENIGLILQDAREAIKTSFKNIERGKYTLEYCKKLCFMLLSCFPFLKKMEIKCPDNGNLGDKHSIVIVYKYVDEITLYPNDFYNDERRFVLTQQQLDVLCGEEDSAVINLRMYYLSESSLFNETYQHIYRAFEDNGEEVMIEQPEKKAETDKNIEPNGKQEGKNLRDMEEMRKFMSFNYRNIREFAMIISDAIKNELTIKNNIIAVCQDKYPMLLPDEDIEAGYEELYWDNIITLLLVEMGPSELLEIVLQDKTDSIFLNVIDQIGWRCIGREKVNLIKNKYYKKVKYLHEYCKKNDALLEAEIISDRVKRVLEVMHFINESNEEAEEFKAFEETLSYKYEKIVEHTSVLEQYKQKNVDLDACDESEKELVQLFRRIFIFMIIFYSAMDAYAIESEKYDSEKRKDEDEDDYKSRIADYRRKCLIKFTDAAADKFIEVEDFELTELYESFCTLCEEYSPKAGKKIKDQNSLEKVKRLKKLITRSYICDAEKLRYFANITLESGKKSTIFKMLEEMNPKYYRDINYLNWLDRFRDLFFFLIYNEDYCRPGLYKSKEELRDKDCDPIYPYLITYYNENVDRDSIKKCSYRVPVPIAGGKANAADQGFVVTILSEMSFPSSSHFCIPLRYGSSDNWWINPFLIPRMFVRKMEEAVKLKFKSQGEQTKNY